MRALAWVFRIGCAALAVLLLFPPAMTWLQALTQEPLYSAKELASSGVALPALGIMCCAATLLFLMLAKICTHTPPRPWRALELAGDEGGLLVFEFALVFPFILSLVFILFQWAEILMCDSIVHYAAFCATRTASTYASELMPGRFTFQNGDQRAKQMLESATFALAPAMALEGLPAGRRMQPKVTLLNPQGATTNEVSPQEVRLKRYQSVGVQLDWGVAPRWPIVGLFFKPLLTNGKLLLTRWYRMEVEPYVISDNLFPADLAFRHERSRRALHQKVFPVKHDYSFRTWYSARGVLEQKNLDRCPEGRFNGPLGSWGDIMRSMWGQDDPPQTPETPTTAPPAQDLERQGMEGTPR